VYAIGVILYEMLTGRLPFDADSYTALALKHIHEEPPPLSQFNPHIPAQLESIVHKVLAKEPSARYRTAEQFGRILISYRREALLTTAGRPVIRLEEAPSAVRPPAPPAPPRRPEVSPARPAAIRTPPVADEGEEAEEEAEIDWLGIILGALALIAILGLFPLWAIVYRAYTTSSTPPPAPPPGAYVPGYRPWYAQAEGLPVAWDK